MRKLDGAASERRMEPADGGDDTLTADTSGDASNENGVGDDGAGTMEFEGRLSFDESPLRLTFRRRRPRRQALLLALSVLVGGAALLAIGRSFFLGSASTEVLVPPKIQQSPPAEKPAPVPPVILPPGYCDGVATDASRHEAGSSGPTQDIRRRLASRQNFHQSPRQFSRQFSRQLDSREDAVEKARETVSWMTFDERVRMVRGVGWKEWTITQGYYVGNILAIPRLGIPSLNIQDAGQGFRTLAEQQVGQVTSFPCLLALGATWDASLSRAYGEAIGREFKAKGANVVLGPAVNVHRVPRNGRNAEYVSGEEPSLGAKMAAAYTLGAQSEGVAAVVKHFVLNSQELNRGSQSVHVDDRTLWEVYYPPFEAAVDAGVAAAMCSYNKIDGEYACGHSRTLQRDLKGAMAHVGWVMSDWWAVHDVGFAGGGCDQEMPGSGWPPEPKGFFANDTRLKMAGDVGEMAARVLAGMLISGVTEESAVCRVGCDCDHFLYEAVATSAQNRVLARDVAASSAVLLKNEGQTLPLKPTTRVALVGSACSTPHHVRTTDDWKAGDYYVMGGSGRVLSSRALSIREALSRRNVHLVVSPNDSVDDAAAAAADADVVLACGGATSTESIDRDSLKLDQHDFLVKLARVRAFQREAANAANAANEHNGDSASGDFQTGSTADTTADTTAGTMDDTTRSMPPLVVLALAPGAVLTDWALDADAAMIMFLAGEATGEAWADVLLGQVNPSGKLPLTLPAFEDDVVAPCPQQECQYSEGLNVGWRNLIDKPVNFPFGWGLSYTTFSFEWADRPAAADTAKAAADKTAGSALFEMSVLVANTGAVVGTTVVQCYVAFPRFAGEPKLVLRDFARTSLIKPRESTVVHLELTERDLSIWDNGWKFLRNATFGVHIGSSSRELHVTHQLST